MCVCVRYIYIYILHISVAPQPPTAYLFFPCLVVCYRDRADLNIFLEGVYHRKAEGNVIQVFHWCKTNNKIKITLHVQFKVYQKAIEIVVTMVIKRYASFKIDKVWVSELL